MNVTEEVLCLELDALLAEFGPAAGELRSAGGQAVRVESLDAADLTDAKWCFCPSALFDTRVGA